MPEVHQEYTKNKLEMISHIISSFQSYHKINKICIPRVKKNKTEYARWSLASSQNVTTHETPR